MESQYQQFGSPDNISARGEQRMAPQTGWKRMLVYVLYGVLVLLLLILLMVTGIKFSQLNKEVTDVKLLLERIGNGGSASAHSSGARPDVKVLVKPLVPVQGTCREGWSSFQRSCYLLSNDLFTWSKAEEQCRTHGGHLLVLNTVEELDYISQIVIIRYSYWIGLVEREHEGHWTWVDGTNYNSTPTFWDVGQPDNWDYVESGEDCGQLHGSEQRKRKLWNDADCNLVHRYICESRA
ncbi:asialoglycoprotein receptor-like 1 [Dicentrarchus labrax]|uniref:Asialoglycoprotein receptor-like 1 n=1 Tax=Dicentrarchus labrax TaxID=13489 RepID=A0A8C4EYC9_DICLA|nr:asialoglycoprotein receptor-like 1 [Dicentrarchus labrax]